MKYEIEIPDGVIPDSHEPFAFRDPLREEAFVTDDGKLGVVKSDWSVPRLILRRKWTWPEWLEADRLEYFPDGWWAANEHRSWKIFWPMTNHPEPPDRTRVYTNPRKGAT